MIYMDHKTSVQLNKLKKHFIFCPVLQAVSRSRRSLRFTAQTLGAVFPITLDKRGGVSQAVCVPLAPAWRRSGCHLALHYKAFTERCLSVAQCLEKRPSILHSLHTSWFRPFVFGDKASGSSSAVLPDKPTNFLQIFQSFAALLPLFFSHLFLHLQEMIWHF